MKLIAKNRNYKGFTLAELLIVVAIIAVLVAIAIPILNNQLEKSREAHDVATMRQAASLAVEYYYNDPSGKNSGLLWWDNKNPDANNAAGVYDPVKGTFKGISSQQVKESDAYGEGTTIDTGATYKYSNGNKNRDIYAPGEDYTKAVVMIAIYPEGSNKHIDVYWKTASQGGKTGTYVGGQTKANDPKYSIRLPLK